MEVVRGHFRPEFLNRLDEIILFHRLSAGHMGPIVDIQVARLQKLLEDRKIRLELTDAARAWLGRVGYDPVYGARPLKRAVQKYLQDPLAIEGRRAGYPARLTSLVAVGTTRAREAFQSVSHVLVALRAGLRPLLVGAANTQLPRQRTDDLGLAALDVIRMVGANVGIIGLDLGRRHG